MKSDFQKPGLTISMNGNHNESGKPLNQPSITLTEKDRRAAARQRAQTNFLDDYETTSLRSILYNSSRHLVGNTPMLRVLTNLIWLAAIIATIIWVGSLIFTPNASIPLRMLALSVGGLLFAIGISSGMRNLRQKDFVIFEETPLPPLEPEKMLPEDKVALHVTGHFSVEGRYQRYTYLPGFYRTFGTREHALLCLRRARSFWGISRWPVEEVGMWYIFFRPELIQQIRWGQLHFGRDSQNAIAVDYELTIPPGGLRRREQVLTETVYLVCQDADDAHWVLADLLYDWEE
ncbi:MAG: hypothetical protein AAF639_24195 [Chloroflexota bacterium]